MMTKVDLTDKPFGLLTVLRLSDTQSKSASPLWDCVCKCGATRKARTSALRSGSVWACHKCIRTEKIPAEVLRLRESTPDPIMAESPYIRDWRNYLESFSSAEQAEFRRIMKGRKPTTVNLAEAVDVVKREKL